MPDAEYSSDLQWPMKDVGPHKNHPPPVFFLQKPYQHQQKHPLFFIRKSQGYLPGTF